MLIPVISEIAHAMRKVWSRNSRSGMTGSAACRAETSHAAPSASAAAPSPMITGDVQG
jgi:phage gp16-like protein